MPELNELDEKITALGWARNHFIALVYPELFGRDFDSDSVMEITSLNLTGLLMRDEAHLQTEGLFDIGSEVVGEKDK